MEKDIQLLKSIGLSEQKAKETLKNLQVTNNLKEIINETIKYGTINNVNGTLIYHLASNIKMQIINSIPLLTQYIVEKKLDSVQRLDCALNYLLHNVGKIINFEEFNNVCGIGIVITSEEIKKEVEKCIQKYKNEIIEKRYRFNSGILMQEIRNSLKWADGRTIKNEIDMQLYNLLGQKLESDCKLIKQSKQINYIQSEKHNENTPEKYLTSNSESIKINDIMKSKINFHKPGENFKTDGYICTNNTQKLLKEHLIATGGEIRTRFPPEPNGILHIGHAKAININFGYAATNNGSCYLRYDDTNPEKEEEKFVKGISDMVQWLGYKPTKITFASDYFDSLFKLAVLLIEQGLAYVCHQSSTEIKGFNPVSSPWRDRPVSENLRIFQDMKDGLLDEGEATLRMKVTLEEGKQDPVAYRIKFSRHHRTTNEWCIYPTYDFTHCLCDSIENITHSLCTKEFQSRRSSYYWLCNAVDIYCPVQWEYGRLNISYTVVSKRKIAKLINEKVVNDWDDPRLLTLSALQRRGVPFEAINKFCTQMGVTGAQTVVDPSVLDTVVRETLNTTSARHMVVLEPLKVTIINFPFDEPVMIHVPDFPSEKNKDNHLIVFDKIIYIESSDFRQEADNKFRRLTLNQSVGLKYAGVVLTVQEIKKDKYGSIVNIVVRQECISEINKPKAFIQWVSQPSLAHIRIYERLFQHKNPEDENQVPKGFLSDINYNSKKETFAYMDINFKRIIKHFKNYQFERIGFFSVDPDSNSEKVIFNRTVTLKETNYKL